MRSDLLRDRVEIGPLAGLEFGVDEFTVDANFEGTTAGRDQPGSHAHGLTNASRQTGGFRFVISDRAVFDRYFRFHACLLYLFTLCVSDDAVEAEPLQRGSRDLGFSGIRKSSGCLVETDWAQDERSS